MLTMQEAAKMKMLLSSLQSEVTPDKTDDYIGAIREATKALGRAIAERDKYDIEQYVNARSA